MDLREMRVSIFPHGVGLSVEVFIDIDLHHDPPLLFHEVYETWNEAMRAVPVVLGHEYQRWLDCSTGYDRRDEDPTPIQLTLLG